MGRKQSLKTRALQVEGCGLAVAPFGAVRSSALPSRGEEGESDSIRLNPTQSDPREYYFEHLIIQLGKIFLVGRAASEEAIGSPLTAGKWKKVTE
jgi:hypothetical protein